MSSAKTPKLFLAGEVTDEMTFKVIPFLQENRRRKVEIFINSEGGSVQQALQIYQLIKNHGKVTTIAVAECSSAATLILAGANERLAMFETDFLIHHGSEGSNSRKETWNNETKYIRMVEIYNSIGIPDDMIKHFMNYEETLTTAAALKYKLITGIYT